MPKATEKALKKVAKKKGLTGKRKNAFVYGTMRKTGWKPGQKEAPSKPMMMSAIRGKMK